MSSLLLTFSCSRSCSLVYKLGVFWSCPAYTFVWVVFPTMRRRFLIVSFWSFMMDSNFRISVLICTNLSSYISFSLFVICLSCVFVCLFVFFVLDGNMGTEFVLSFCSSVVLSADWLVFGILPVCPLLFVTLLFCCTLSVDTFVCPNVL